MGSGRKIGLNVGSLKKNWAQCGLNLGSLKKNWAQCGLVEEKLGSMWAQVGLKLGSKRAQVGTGVVVRRLNKHLCFFLFFSF